MSTLSIQNLSTRNLSDVTFDVHQGECVCIHGESGSGKTLLLRAIADLDPSEGSVLLDRQERNTISAHDWRRQVTFLPAESHWWHESVSAHFTSKVPQFKDLDLIPEIIDWQINRLSTGERQRLSLLRALDHQPTFLLMDETTANLDEENTLRVEKFIRQKLEQGLGIIWVSHSQQQRLRMADHAWKIHDNTLIEE